MLLADLTIYLSNSELLVHDICRHILCMYKHTRRLTKMWCLCLCVRASNDLKTHMVAVDTMEQFQKELDQGKVRNTAQTRPKTFHCPSLPDILN